MKFKLDFRNFTVWDMALTKWSVFFIALFFVSVCSCFASWVISVHWLFFLAVGLALAIKPMLAVFGCKKVKKK